jgi:uroporphyrinogen decarboxylase
MRQAGRYMPEYQAIRKRVGFMELCQTPEIAAEASLLPLTILDVDALIIFNDILVPLDAMGCDVAFGDAGPVIGRPMRDAARLDADFRAIDFGAPGAEPVVAKSIAALRAAAGPDIPVFGFVGAPFTMACYAIEGKMSRDLHEIKRLRFESPALLHAILERLATTVASYAIAQVKLGGADAVQLFDTWAGELSEADYAEFAHRWQVEAIDAIRDACPGVPIQLYVKNGAHVLGQAARAGADVLSVDHREPLSSVRRRVGAKLALQGNLDPICLNAAPEHVAPAVERMLEGFDPRRGFIANLGHGILPQGRVESAKAFVKAIQALANEEARP